MIEIAITSSSGLSAQRADHVGEHRSDAGERQELGVHHRADADEENLRGGGDRVLQAFDEPFEVQLALKKADHRRQERAGRAGLGRRHDAGEQPADDRR